MKLKLSKNTEMLRRWVLMRKRTVDAGPISWLEKKLLRHTRTRIHYQLILAVMVYAMCNDGGGVDQRRGGEHKRRGRGARRVRQSILLWWRSPPLVQAYPSHVCCGMSKRTCCYHHCCCCWWLMLFTAHIILINFQEIRTKLIRNWSNISAICTMKIQLAVIHGD